MVRVYVSSTYTDMMLEKNVLVTEVYPRLKELCRERYGLEFQGIIHICRPHWGMLHHDGGGSNILRMDFMNGSSSVVDMRWGVRDESTDDHATAAICLEEIRQCQATSVGPSFVYFAGQKYGYRPLPSVIGCEVSY